MVGRSDEWARNILNGFLELGLLEKEMQGNRQWASKYWYVPLKNRRNKK